MPDLAHARPAFGKLSARLRGNCRHCASQGSSRLPKHAQHGAEKPGHPQKTGPRTPPVHNRARLASRRPH
eukprot:11221886-Lingulodinium_polyedra.AAC.1